MTGPRHLVDGCFKWPPVEPLANAPSFSANVGGMGRFPVQQPPCAAERYPSNTASAPFTASAPSVTAFSSDAACTEMFSAKNRASVT
jgi:hypothetical protein